MFDSLGQLRYLSAIKEASLVIGNSSSGLIEVPYFNIPTVNCGDRQLGRERPESIFDCPLERMALLNTIETGLNYKGKFERIFGNGDTSENIFNIIKGIDSFKIRKEFYDL